MSQKTSIKIKKFWYADVADDGGLGTNWKEIQLGLREASVQFNGSDADTTNYKNILGSILESQSLKGDKTMNFQMADLTPAEIAAFVGGTVTNGANSERYDAPENENNAIEKSIRFLTDKNVQYEMPRVVFDGYPIINDDDLHYYQMNSVVLLPAKSGVSIYSYDVLKLPDENDITSFTFGALDDAPATITAGTHTVTITVVNGTDPATLTPVMTASLGASLDPQSGVEDDFTNPVTVAVESADGASQDWTITVSVAA